MPAQKPLQKNPTLKTFGDLVVAVSFLLNSSTNLIGAQVRQYRLEIARKDGESMGIAGLWSTWGQGSQKIDSFTMLTINADDHSFMNQFHKAGEEKRMVVILPKASGCQCQFTRLKSF